MKINLFSKIFIITFSVFSVVLSVYMYELRSSQKNFLIQNLETKGKSLADMIHLVNSDNMILNDQVKIFESVFNFVETNKDVLSITIVQKDMPSIFISHNGWKTLNEKNFKENIKSKIIDSKYLDKKVYQYVYEVIVTKDHWGRLLLNLSLENYYTQLEKLNKQFASLIFFMVLSSIFISYLLARIVSKPIIQLKDISLLISKGDLTQRVDVKSKDEIGIFAKTFNEMVENLETSQKKLTNYKLDLEKEVALRTKELKELNENLEHRVSSEIKKRQEQEQLLIQQSKLAAMGEMIGNIAHQWRQPLNALSLVFQNIKFSYDFGDLDDEFMDKSIKKVNLLTNNMSKTIDDFRNFFRPNKEKIAFNLDQKVSDSLQLIDATFENSKIKIEKHIDSNIIIFGFPNEFLQTMLNILNNSKDAFIENNIKNAKIILSVKRDLDKAYITIQDNAGGIPEHVKDKIFEPYFTTKEEGKGTGIGLYMSKIIIEQNMNGKLTNENVSDGTIFAIELPLYKG